MQPHEKRVAAPNSQTAPTNAPPKQTIPSERECLKLLQKYDSQPTVVAHSKVVAKAAKAIARELAEKGVKVSVERVFAAALLHDIAKLEKNARGEWKPRHDHARKGAQILRKEGLAEIALIAERHVAESGDEVPKSWEEITVFYADKRVEWDQLASIEERFAALKRRYGSRAGAVERLDEVWPFVKKVEKKIFGKLGRKPDELQEMMEEGK